MLMSMLEHFFFLNLYDERWPFQSFLLCSTTLSPNFYFLSEFLDGFDSQDQLNHCIFNRMAFYIFFEYLDRTSGSKVSCVMILNLRDA